MNRASAVPFTPATPATPATPVAPAASPSPAAAPPPAMPADGCALGQGEGSLPLSPGMMQKVFSHRGLQKEQHAYEQHGFGFGPDGKPLHTVAIGPDLAMFRMTGLAPDGRAIIANQKRVALADPATGLVEMLTDHTVDHSWRLAADAAEDPAGADPARAGTVRVEPEYVEVGGVRVPRRPAKGDAPPAPGPAK